MHKHPNALMLSLIGLLLAVIGLGRLQQVWRHILLAVIVAGIIIGWVVYLNLLTHSL
ncbi:MAG: hypothetical protein BroJett011_74690 [Chloroflexota bacterium]|nr:MAG: hypothetical protein BroJett011_74690 [Chloroflexota bacterium]